MRRHPLASSAGLLALGLLVLLGVAFMPTPEIETVRRQVADSGVWGPATYLALMVGTTQVPVPRTIWTVSAGVIFGSLIGCLLAIGGMALSAALSMMVVRWMAGPAVRRAEDNDRVRLVQEVLSERGWTTVLGLRMIPVIPFSLLNYACGLSRIPMLPCLAATVAGSIPLTVVAVVAADAVVAYGDPRVVLIGVVVGLTGLVIAGREVLSIQRQLAGQGPTVDRNR